MEPIKSNPTLYIDDISEEDLTTSTVSVSEEDPANRFISLTVLSDNPELEDIKKRVKEIELQAETLKIEQERVLGAQMKLYTVNEHPLDDPEIFVDPTDNLLADNPDHRSVYVKNVDYQITPNQLSEHFAGCGPVLRATIPKNRADNNHPKGYGYVEFGDLDAMRAALKMNETMLNGRVINVYPKRANRPGMSQTNRIIRGQGRGGFVSGAFGRNETQPQLDLEKLQLPDEQPDLQNQQKFHQLQFQQQQQLQQQQSSQPIYSMYQPGI